MVVGEPHDTCDTRMRWNVWTVSWYSYVHYNGKLARLLAKAWERCGDQESRLFRVSSLGHLARLASAQAQELTKNDVTWVQKEEMMRVSYGLWIRCSSFP